MSAFFITTVVTSFCLGNKQLITITLFHFEHLFINYWHNVYFIALAGNFDRFQENFEEIVLIKTLTEAVIIIIFSLWMIFYGILIRLKIQEVENDEVSKKSMFRINIVVFSCIISLSLRVLALFILLFHLNTHFFESDEFDNVEWFIFSQWVPTVVTVIIRLNI